MKYIYNHLGLGDHVICNGLYRELCNHQENYTLFVKHHNVTTVSFMLKDLKNILIRPVNDDDEVINFLSTEQIEKESLIVIGFCQIPLPGAKDFDDTFYLQHGVSFDKRWSSFKCDNPFVSLNRIFDINTDNLSKIEPKKRKKLLQQILEKEVEVENYEQAAVVRDLISDIQD